MSEEKTLFLIGPGFIGREILDRLLVEDYQVTTLVRREAAAAEFHKIGVQTRTGDLDDKETITDQASKSDIIIHTATADHLPSVQAIIAGIDIRAKAGKKTIYIHNSGTGVVADDSQGDYKSEKVYEDDKPEDIDALPDSAPHRFVDLEIIAARKRIGGDKAKIVIVLPPVIYGFNEKYGRHSIQMPTLIRFALKQRYAGHVGKGLARWNAVHVFDLARAYVMLLHWLEQADGSEGLKNPYYFCENGEDFAWGDAAATIGKSLHALGKVDSIEPRTIPVDEYDYLFGDQATKVVVGSNSRVRANRLRELGWRPQEKGLFESLVEDEIPNIMKEKGQFQGYARVVA